MEDKQTLSSRLTYGFLAAVIAGIFPLLIPLRAAAGVIEASGSFFYTKTTYGDESYSWNRRWGASLAYYLTERSNIELAFQDSFSRNKIIGLEDTTFHDKTYSANWVQHITGRDFPVQPYFKLGVGQLNQDATGVYAIGGSPPQRYDSLTTVLGGGLKILLTHTFGLRAEVTSYLTDINISTWKQNLSATAGFSIFF